ncbi:MAG: DMT family transporter [Sphingomonas sp.]|uniref:DMT family transporter n=1 Tax=Sphingomonas sp. TaxID=28214 RepID=UPI001AC0A666|nr:DMT family transporter [Sphingomonas sp.]MBN8809482.1 DMT family transporter [Sphingomonas sp.]
MSGGAQPSFTAFAALMFVAGMGIPLMATLNAGLGQHLQSPVAASTILFALALAVTAAILALGGVPARAAFTGVPWYFYAGAVLVVFYLLSITWTTPRIGVGNAVFFVLLGQLVAAAAIDHFGWFGAIRSELTLRRVAGLAVMAIGVYLARKPR